MSTAAEQLDLIATADRDVRAAEVREVEAVNALRLARLAVRHAKQRLADTIRAVGDEKRQPRLPFDEAVSAAVAEVVTPPVVRPDPPAPVAAPEPPPVPLPVVVGAKSWRDMSLYGNDFEADWTDDVFNAVTAGDVATCGQLAERLLAGELFGLELSDLQPVYASIEQISSDDAEPIRFGAEEESDLLPEPVRVPEMVLGVDLVGVKPSQLDRANVADKISFSYAGSAPQKAGPGVIVGGVRYVCFGTESPDDSRPDVEKIWSLDRLYDPAAWVMLRRDIPARLSPGRSAHGYYAGLRVICDGKECVVGPESDGVRVVLKAKGEPGKKPAKAGKKSPVSGNPDPVPSYEVGSKPFPAAVEHSDSDRAPAKAAVTLLAEVDGFPDAVWDKLFPLGVSSLETLLEAVEKDAGTPAEMPLRNRLVAHLVRRGCRLIAAERAADAVAAHVLGAKAEPPAPKKKSAVEQLEDLGLLSKSDAPAIVIPTGPEPELPCSPASNEKGEPFYGWDITYRDVRGKHQTCHYVGTEKKARHKAMLRTGYEKLVECKGLTKDAYVRGYGKGRM